MLIFEKRHVVADIGKLWISCSPSRFYYVWGSSLGHYIKRRESQVTYLLRETIQCKMTLLEACSPILRSIVEAQVKKLHVAVLEEGF